MRMSAAFPSAYIKAADLNGRRVRVEMDRVEMEDVGGELKPVMFFLGSDKKMIVNKTNASEIIDAYGDDTDAWHGQMIELYEARVDFQGKKVAAVRVNAMLGKPMVPVASAFDTQAPIGRSLKQPPQQRHDDDEQPSNGALPKDDPFSGDEIPF